MKSKTIGFKCEGYCEKKVARAKEKSGCGVIRGGPSILGPKDRDDSFSTPAPGFTGNIVVGSLQSTRSK